MQRGQTYLYMCKWENSNMALPELSSNMEAKLAVYL